MGTVLLTRVCVCVLLQDSEIFINDKKTGEMETFWNPTQELRQNRLTRCTVTAEEQNEFESERSVSQPGLKPNLNSLDPNLVL